VSRLQPVIFSTLGVFTVSQELSGMAMSVLQNADPELVAEESLCLASVATARSIEASAGEEKEWSDSLLVTPFLYRDFLVGTAMLEAGDPDKQEAGPDIGERLERKMAFYAVHLPASTLPTGSVLRNALLLWMGRISPPGMSTGPEERLDACGAIERLQTHVRLLAAHARHVSGS